MKTKILLYFLFACILSCNFIYSQDLNWPGSIHDLPGDDMPEFSYPGPKSPQFSENGAWFPPTGTVNVLVVFAEIDRTLCGSCGDSTDALSASWPQGQLPYNVKEQGTGNDIFNKTYFDRTLPTGTAPTPGSLTEFYYQMSFGQHIVLGDYYPEMITIPCSSIPGGITGNIKAALNVINSRTLNTTLNPSGEFASKTGMSLGNFDKLSESSNGEVKATVPNGRIDCFILVLRNTACNYDKCGGGYAVWPWQGGDGSTTILKQNTTTNYTTFIGGSWKACDANVGMFKGEYMHGLFGGNHWHSGNNGGESESRTFINSPNTFSLTSYSMVGQLACAYDRYHLGWFGWKNEVDGVKKQFLISAKTSTQDEVNTDLNINSTFPNGNEFIIRDFITYGDAIRIKLPYINWTANGNVKNQYIWIENHQKISSFDKSQWEPSTCKESWSKGIYAYLQVGKDQKNESLISDVYSQSSSHPNGLGSWFFALQAEGNYDYKYRYDLAGFSSDNCVWDNKYLPIDKYSSETKPNPFTGMNDLFNYVDYENDGLLKTPGSDKYQPWTAEMLNGNVEFHAYAGGDSKDAFKCGVSCPKKILSLGTNPAPVPVYTYTYKSTDNSFPNSGQNSYENRTIWLNGLSVEILEENVNPTQYGQGAVKVKIRFDDYEVNNDVRWCGNIVLNPNYQNPDLSHYALNLMPGKTMLLDRGKSPTQHVGIKDSNGNFILDADGRKIFTQLTFFTVLPNALFHTEENSTVIVDNGSTFTLQSGSRLELHGQMIVRNGSKLIVEDGAEIYLHHTAKLDIDDGGEMIINNNNPSKIITLGNPLLGNTAEWRINSKVTYNSTLDFTFNGSGFISFGKDNQLVLTNNNKFKINGSGKTDLLVKFYDDAVLALSGNFVDIQNGKMEYGSNSRFNVNAGSVFLKNLNIVGSNALYAMDADAVTLFHLQTCDVSGFNTGVRVANVQPLNTTQALGCTFSNCSTAIRGINLDLFVSSATIVQNSISDPRNSNIIGFDFEQTRNVVTNGNQLGNCEKAVQLNNVQGFYMNAGKLQNNIWGIKADNSLVFLRNGAAIDNSEDYGIEITGIAPTIQKPAYRAMLTIGDVGCGAITNSVNGTAIRGENALMNIDAVQHAINRGAPNDVRPNNFYGNQKALDLCYNADDQLIPNEILAKGNFWRKVGNPNDPYGGSAQPSMFTVKKQSGGTPCSANILVDASCHSSCKFLQIQTSCMNCQSNSLCQQGNGGNGGGGGIAPPGGIPEECPAKIRLGSGGGKTIDNAFKEANQQFLAVDEMVTRANFKDIADLQLSKSKGGDNIICDINDPHCEPGGGGGGGGNPGERISNPCAQLVLVSKVLHEGTPAMQQRIANPASENNKQEFSTPEITDKEPGISLYPNPNDGNMTLEYYLAEGESGRFIIRDMTGRRISEYELAAENNQLIFSENKLTTGVFYYQVLVDQTPVKTGKLTVIK